MKLYDTYTRADGGRSEDSGGVGGCSLSSLRTWESGGSHYLFRKRLMSKAEEMGVKIQIVTEEYTIISNTNPQVSLAARGLGKESPADPAGDGPLPTANPPAPRSAKEEVQRFNGSIAPFALSSDGRVIIVCSAPYDLIVLTSMLYSDFGLLQYLSLIHI